MKYCTFEQTGEHTARCTQPDCGRVVRFPESVKLMPDWVSRLRASCPQAKLPEPDPERAAKLAAERQAALDAYRDEIDPTFAAKGVHYLRAIVRWIRAGRPKRTDEEVVAIMAICRGCDQWNAASESCRVCGCNVNESRWALASKARMGTESCARRKW